MKLKRLTALLLSVMMVLSLAACGGGGDTKDDSASGDLSGKEIIIGNITPVTGRRRPTAWPSRTPFSWRSTRSTLPAASSARP